MEWLAFLIGIPIGAVIWFLLVKPRQDREHGR